MIIFVCAAPNLANETAISNMVMHLQIGININYSQYVLGKQRDARYHLSSRIFQQLKPRFFFRVVKLHSLPPKVIKFVSDVTE
jgi:hypothetical protein